LITEQRVAAKARVRFCDERHVSADNRHLRPHRGRGG
jgi:hypothetical protein